MLLSFLRSSISLGDREKKATSEPEISAEHNNNIITNKQDPPISKKGKSAKRKEILKKGSKIIPGSESN